MRPAICTCGPQDALGCPVCSPGKAAARVAEYARQRRMSPGLDPDDIGALHSDPEADMAWLHTADLEYLSRGGS